MTVPPLVTVVIPTLNEAADIGACIAAVGAQDHPLERLEVIVVDGGSDDGTPAAARSALDGHPFARGVLVDNTGGSTPSNLNRGLSEAQGEILCRVDARSVVPPHYVRVCASTLGARPDVAVVGGAQVASVEPDAPTMERAIVRALRNPYVMGGSAYRLARRSGASDTVYLGAFRTADLRRAGGWDERFATNQDFELNRRMSDFGLVWFEAGLEVAYRPRRTLGALARQYHRFGRWKGASWASGAQSLSGRHAILVTAPPVALAVMARIVARRPLFGVLTLVGAVAAVERQSGPGRGAAERIAAVVPMAVAPTAWWAGVMVGLLTRRPGARAKRA